MAYNDSSCLARSGVSYTGTVAVVARGTFLELDRRSGDFDAATARSAAKSFPENNIVLEER